MYIHVHSRGACGAVGRGRAVGGRGRRAGNGVNDKGPCYRHWPSETDVNGKEPNGYYDTMADLIYLPKECYIN